MTTLAYSPPHTWRCASCKVYSKGTVKCGNCGAKRTGKEKRI